MTYLESLDSELARVGIGGRLRRRILLEIGDHLECDPEAALGDPGALARQFADELGTARSRRAAFATFGALALVAGLLAASFVSSRAVAGVVWPRTPRHSVVLGDVAVVLVVICAQVAFVAGLLAAARALRRRSDPVLPRAEATVIGRRAIVALLAGIGTLAGLALVAIEYDGAVPSWWRISAGTAAGVGICALAAFAVAVRSALRVKPTAPGVAGDVFEDVGALVPRTLRGRPWAFALTVAAGVAVVLTVLGVAQSDPFDGALNGIVDALACLAGFAALGRYLGLRAAGD